MAGQMRDSDFVNDLVRGFPEENEGADECWGRREMEEHFQFGPEFFGMEKPYHIQVAEVNASVLTTLLLIRVGSDQGRQLVENERLWDELYTMILRFYMSWD